MSTAARGFAGEIRAARAADYARMAEFAGQLTDEDAGELLPTVPLGQVVSTKGLPGEPLPAME